MPSVHPVELCIGLARAQAAVVRQFDRRLGTLHGISLGDFIVLWNLARAEGGKLRRMDLAAEVGVTASAVTRTLIPLERIGLVVRQPDPRDARVGYAVLTRAGRRLLDDAMVSAEVSAEDALAGIKRGEREALFAMLAHLAR